LVTRPDHDLGNTYLMYWSKKLIELAADKSLRILDLKSTKATRKEFTSRVKKMKPDLMLLNGHGSPAAMTGDDNKPVLDLHNASLTSGAVVYARSCHTATVLGPECINKGAKAYIGYKEPFVLCYDLAKITHPIDDEIAAMFLEPSNQVVISLLKGHTAIESSERSKDATRRKMRELMSSNAPQEAGSYIKYLWHNMRNQECLGDPDAKI
jgi:hypothetical protein